MLKYLFVCVLLLTGCGGDPTTTQPDGGAAAATGEQPGKFSIVTRDGRIWPPKRQDR